MTPAKFAESWRPLVPRIPYRVYIDEAGDRGWGGRASPIFVLSAVMLPEAGTDKLRETLDEINNALGKPGGTVVHWAQNIKTHSQRKFVSSRIAGTDVTLTNVVVLKQELIGSGTQTDRDLRPGTQARREPPGRHFLTPPLLRSGEPERLTEHQLGAAPPGAARPFFAARSSRAEQSVGRRGAPVRERRSAAKSKPR